MTKGKITVKVLRYNPDEDRGPSYQTYEVTTDERMMALQLLKSIFEEQDRTLAFRYYSCGWKWCNGCMMTINGKVKHGCMTPIEPGEEVVIEPLKGYPVIRDLVVDFGRRVATADGTFLIQSGTIVTKVAAK